MNAMQHLYSQLKPANKKPKILTPCQNPEK